MSNAPKSMADALAGMAGIVKLLDALESGQQITEEMVAAVEKVNGPCPPDVREAIQHINGYHAMGINKQTLDSKTSNAAAEEKVPTSPDIIRIMKDPANYLSDDDEDAEVVEVVKEFMELWGKSPRLSEKFPLKVAATIFYGLGVSATNDGGEYQMNILRVLDMTRESIVEDMLAKGTGGLKCH